MKRLAVLIDYESERTNIINEDNARQPKQQVQTTTSYQFVAHCRNCVYSESLLFFRAKTGSFVHCPIHATNNCHWNKFCKHFGCWTLLVISYVFWMMKCMKNIYRVKNSCALHRTFNVEPIYLQHENSGWLKLCAKMKCM